jgi:hypothetical protein
MNHYLLIESLDPFESNDVGRQWELAVGLVRGGNRVTLFLVQNGVLAAREGARNDTLQSVAAAGVDVLADEFSLRERGIGAGALMACVKPAPLDVVLDRLADGCKALWH